MILILFTSQCVSMCSLATISEILLVSSTETWFMLWNICIVYWRNSYMHNPWWLYAQHIGFIFHESKSSMVYIGLLGLNKRQVQRREILFTRAADAWWRTGADLQQPWGWLCYILFCMEEIWEHVSVHSQWGQCEWIASWVGAWFRIQTSGYRNCI